MVCEGRTEKCQHAHKGLHDAILVGCIEALCHLLEANADVNGKDNSGNTPLLLAVCIEQEEVYNAIVRLLIESGADVNAYNKGFTPLYNAVFYKRQESVKMLLQAGAWLRPSYRNELHLLSEIGGSNILELILRDKRCTADIINMTDENGRTALHIAAQFYHRNCLKMLIKHGGNLAAVNNDGESVVDIIFERFINPEKFIRELLDDNIVMVQTATYKHYYDIDFSVLAPKTCERQMEVISNLLAVASEEEKTDVIQHPVIELYLLLKWSKICYFFYFWIALYVIFAFSIGVHVSLLIHKNKKFEVFHTVVRCTLILTASGLLGHAILQCILDRRNYLRRYEIWMNLICTCLSLTVAAAADGGISSGPNGSDTPNWVLHVSSIAVLMAWIELMLLIGRLPSLGYYALMFSAVLQNVVKVLLAFLCLVIGFALSFSIQFHSCEEFADPWRALVKTTAMMMGEFDYGDLFAGDVPRLPVVSRVVFVAFVVLASIVLMNLTVGVAVSDIQELQRLGFARRLEKQAEFLCQLEKVVTSRHINSKYVPALVKKIFARRSLLDGRYKMKTSTEFQRAEKIPRRLIDSIVSIAKGRKQLQGEN